MHLKEENPHPRNEAKAVTVRGQVDKGIGRVRLRMRNSDFSLMSRLDTVLQALYLSAT